MLELYKNIKKRRLELGMTQEELRTKLGYTDRSTISKIEKGDRDLSLTKIKEFAKALDTTPSELLGEVDDIESRIGFLVAEETATDKELLYRLIDSFHHMDNETKNLIVKMCEKYTQD